MTVNTPSPTQLRIEKKKMRDRIRGEISGMYRLESSARIIVDYIYSLNENAVFEPHTEWVLEPDKWIAIKFTKVRKEAIHVSIACSIAKPRPDLPLKDGRFVSWSRFTLTSVSQIPSAMLYIEEAFLTSETGYRKRFGYPKKT
jgi:hypothetical protein